MLAELYRKIVPGSVRQFIYKYFLRSFLETKKYFNVSVRSKFTYWFKSLLPNTPLNEAYYYLGKNGLTFYPYSYMSEYINLPIEVYYDPKHNLSYTLYNDKKLFFRKSSNDSKIRDDFRILLSEQDIRSPHRYIRFYDELKGRTLLDIGGAEGIFSLDAIEYAEQIFIFECDPEWIAPLEATFEPWKQKVSIIKKYVGNMVSENYITIDELFANKNDNNIFIKMDIEGGEWKAIEGAVDTCLQSNSIKWSICTYHNKMDASKFMNYFNNLKFSTEFAEGYILYGGNLNKGILRCSKDLK